MRLYLGADSDDAAAMPELETWLSQQPPTFLEANPTPIRQARGGSMSGLIAAIEVIAATAELAKFLTAMARRHELDREPAITVAASWPDGRAYRVESSDPEAVAEIIRALNGQ